MDVFYNAQGIGDVLIIPVKEGDRDQIKHESYGDVVKITDKQDGSLLGYNIFHASKYFSIEGNGKIRLTEEMLEPIKELFSENKLEDLLNFDLSDKFVVGYVKEKAPHENADKLSVCQVDLGDEVVQIVCGAPNIDQGQKVVVAKVGATMPGGMRIKEAKLRGVESYGMICSAKELNLPDAPQEKGILVLEGDYKPGEPFELPNE